ncbi:hypothetical protein SRHO_G00030550 [Serrasalmus rhombeus]
MDVNLFNGALRLCTASSPEPPQATSCVPSSPQPLLIPAETEGNGLSEWRYEDALMGIPGFERFRVTLDELVTSNHTLYVLDHCYTC